MTAPAYPFTRADKPRFPRLVAFEVARQLVAALATSCERIEIAGSIRTTRPTLPPGEIFPIDAPVNLAREVIDGLLAGGVLDKRLNIAGVSSWGEKNKLAVHLASGIPVDLFATHRHSWWNYLVCRTGGAATNTRIATSAQARGLKWHPYADGFEDLGTGEIIRVRSEEEVFSTAGLKYLDPTERD
ncbi:MAG: hypothetical protein AB1705_27385 [Verrucomicrobiota bacterium]